MRVVKGGANVAPALETRSAVTTFEVIRFDTEDRKRAVETAATLLLPFIPPAPPRSCEGDFGGMSGSSGRHVAASFSIGNQLHPPPARP